MYSQFELYVFRNGEYIFIASTRSESQGKAIVRRLNKICNAELRWVTRNSTNKGVLAYSIVEV